MGKHDKGQFTVAQFIPSPNLNVTHKLDFVHLSGITDGGNRALKKNGKDFNHLVFWVDH